MRLSNRIAATALAAVMAVSMLTACGGGARSAFWRQMAAVVAAAPPAAMAAAMAAAAETMAEAYPWLCLHRTSLKMLALVPKVRVAGPALWVRRSQASAEASMQLLFRM